MLIYLSRQHEKLEKWCKFHGFFSLVQVKPKLVVCLRWGNSKLFYLLLYALISGIFEYCTWISICLPSIFPCNHFGLFNFWFICLLLRLQNVFLSTWQCNANLFSNQMCLQMSMSTCITIECNIITHNTLKWRGNLKWFQNHWLKSEKWHKRNCIHAKEFHCAWLLASACDCNGFKGNVFPLLLCDYFLKSHLVCNKNG